MPTADLDALLSQAKDYAAQSYARNTLSAYAADGQHVTAWCTKHGRHVLPATHEMTRTINIRYRLAGLLARTSGWIFEG